MKNLLNLHFMIAVHLIVVAVLIALSAWYVYEAKANVRLQLEGNIREQTEVLTELARIVDNNGADEVVSSIITDCPRRTEFELLLVKLGSLPQKDLLTVQQLFESCGDFFAERKALMVSKLEREAQTLHSSIALLRRLDSNDKRTFNAERWDELIKSELERSKLLTEQAAIQEDIIRLLVSGNPLTSNEVRDNVARAQHIAEALNILGTKIDETRNSLTG